MIVSRSNVAVNWAKATAELSPSAFLGLSKILTQIGKLTPNQITAIGILYGATKLTGGAAFVQDLRLPNMVHGRVVHPPSYGATLRQVNSAAVERSSDHGDH